jgi:hypothetical protein
MIPLGKIVLKFYRHQREAFLLNHDDSFNLAGYMYRSPFPPIPTEHFDHYWANRRDWFEYFFHTTWTYKGTLDSVFKPFQLLTLRRAIDTFFAAVQKYD